MFICIVVFNTCLYFLFVLVYLSLFVVKYYAHFVYMYIINCVCASTLLFVCMSSMYHYIACWFVSKLFVLVCSTWLFVRVYFVLLVNVRVTLCIVCLFVCMKQCLFVCMYHCLFVCMYSLWTMLDYISLQFYHLDFDHSRFFLPFFIIFFLLSSL